jgi:aspartyl/asparaginyl beta-hydroxylase (cupin superfamily)
MAIEQAKSGEMARWSATSWSQHSSRGFFHMNMIKASVQSKQYRSYRIETGEKVPSAEQRCPETTMN